MPITKKTSAETIIKDFQDSDNPKFAGKSKEERRRMALGAYYSKHPEKSRKSQNESVAEFVNQVGIDKDLAAAAIQAALMDKVSERLEILKAEIAQEQFGFSESEEDDQEEENGHGDEEEDKKAGKALEKKFAKKSDKGSDKDGDEDGDEDGDKDTNGDQDGDEEEDGKPAQKPITGKGDKAEVKEDATSYQVTDFSKGVSKHKQTHTTDKKPLKPTFKPSVK